MLATVVRVFFFFLIFDVLNAAANGYKGCLVHCVLMLSFAFSQLGAESADSIGAVLNSKDEQREIAETRETCRSVE